MPRVAPPARTAAGLVTLAAALGAAAARPAAACSLVPTLTIPVADPSHVAFTGRALADTAAAGAGAVEYRIGPGHFGRPTAAGPGAARPVHGQTVRVDRLAPGVPADVGAAVRRAGGRVVLVPWDHAADCAAVPWARGARWLPDSARGLFEGKLRDRAHWVGGVPTLDVFAPQFVPYTGAASVAAAGRGRPVTGEVLTPDELLDVRSTLPTDDAVRARLDAAYAPLRAWAAAHPALAAREPARTLLQHAEWSVAHLRFLRRPVPLPGTYRVTVWLADAAGAASAAGDSSTFYVRTEDRPSSPAAWPGTWPGMYVLACAMPTQAALPATRPPGGCAPPYAPGAEGYLAFSDTTWADGAGRRLRAGNVDVVYGDSAFRARVRAVRDGRRGDGRRGVTLDVSDPRHFLPGLFTEAPDGRVAFAWTFGPAGAPALRITAERVSDAVLRP